MNSNIINIYQERYADYCSYTDEPTKYEWCASDIFDLATYDDELDELFVKKILEVCQVILDRENFKYIENEDQYIQYIAVCQLLRQMKWIEWGTSIRGAWIDEYSKVNIVEDVRLTKDNLEALISFVWEKRQ